MSNRAVSYSLLAAVFLLAAAYQVRFSLEAVRELTDPDSRAQAPFFVSPPGRSTAEGPAIRFRGQAPPEGLRDGDILLAVDGKPFRGSSTLAVAAAARRPGDTLRIRVKRGSEEIEVAVRLVRQWTGPLQGFGGAALNIWMDLVMPWFCLLIGFWVALVHPHDRRAWLLLALMLSFAHLVRSPDLVSWEDWLRPAAIGFHSLLNSTWPLWVFLFGLYFPEPFDWERRHRALKWIIIVPFAAVALLNAVSAEGASEDYRLASGIDRMLLPHRRFMLAYNMIPISLFFVSIGWKWVAEKKPDSRRRLRLLLAGTLVSMAPMFLFMLHGLLRSPGPGRRGPPWFLFPAFAMMFLFPVTLAYVIVVQRAMDIRVVLRQSVQYALARRGLWALRAVAGAVIVWWAVSLTGREQLSTLETILVGAGAAAAVIATSRLSERAAVWIDRRFFREAYDAERILSELGNEVRTMVEEKTVVDTVARRISESLHVPRVDVRLLSGAASSNGSGIAEHLRRTRKPALVYFDDPNSWVHSLPPEERRALGERGAQVLVPLAVKDKLLGFISLGEKRSEEPYSGNDLRLLETVAAQTALALENSHLAAAIAAEAAQRERLNRELEIAREVQERLFPQVLPAVEGLDYAGFCRPAQGVGGDYYDFLALPDGRFGVAIGDVSGKGVPAALLMASLQASLRGQALAAAGDLPPLMRNLNRLTYDATPPNRYATFFYAQYDPRTRRLSYSNAGHNPPILFHGDDLIRLEAGGIVLGVLPSASYEEAVVQLAPGDCLVAFTDGVSEAVNAFDEEFGEQRLVETAAAARHLGARDLISHILAAVDRFAAGVQQFDDLTLVVMRVL